MNKKDIQQATSQQASSREIREKKAASRKRVKLVIGIVFVAALIVTLFAFLISAKGFVSEQAREQGAITLRESILDASLECFSIEGHYPASLEYLEENYGIVVDHDTYNVIYTVYASNVVPTVEVILNAE